MAETFAVRYTGGPMPGTYFVPDDACSWPLPDERALSFPYQGKYVKKMESKLPPQEPDSPLMRGAEYEWVSDVSKEVSGE